MAFNFSFFTQSKYTFEGKRDDEDVEIFLYSHWIIMVIKTFSYFVMSAVPLGAVLLFSSELNERGFLGGAILLLIAFYMIIWSMYFYEVMIYLLDTWIVTNQRILDIIQKGFFYRTVSELDLTKVQDISVRTSGLIQTVFDFGDVEIQSAGALNKFKFSQVARPQIVKDRIMRLVSEAKKNDAL
jgi:membrane protein YdbS with pleckstrin-like domain